MVGQALESDGSEGEGRSRNHISVFSNVNNFNSTISDDRWFLSLKPYEDTTSSPHAIQIFWVRKVISFFCFFPGLWSLTQF